MSFSGYPDGHDLVTAALLKRFRYGARGGQGYVVFPAAAAEDDHHPNQSAAPLLSNPSILAKGATVVLSLPRREPKFAGAFPQSAGHELYVLV